MIVHQSPFYLSVRQVRPELTMPAHDGEYRPFRFGFAPSFDHSEYEFKPLNWRRIKRHKNRLRKRFQRINKTHKENSKNFIIQQARRCGKNAISNMLPDFLGARADKAVR